MMPAPTQAQVSVVLVVTIGPVAALNAPSGQANAATAARTHTTPARTRGRRVSLERCI